MFFSIAFLIPKPDCLAALRTKFTDGAISNISKTSKKKVVPGVILNVAYRATRSVELQNLDMFYALVPLPNPPLPTATDAIFFLWDEATYYLKDKDILDN